MQEPHVHHVVVVLRYLAGTNSLGLFYPKRRDDEPVLMGYSDSDLVGNIDERKSTIRMISFLGESPMG
jgi:hypothetical protein